MTGDTVAQRIDYDAWGSETANTAPALQALGYAGGLTDPETKFIRFGARDYDPGVGRWTAKDPSGLATLDLGLYLYALQAPLDMHDPSGTDPENSVKAGGVASACFIFALATKDSINQEASTPGRFPNGRARDDYAHGTVCRLIGERYGAPVAAGYAVGQEMVSAYRYCLACAHAQAAGVPAKSLEEFIKDTLNDLRADGAGLRQRTTPKPPRR